MLTNEELTAVAKAVSTCFRNEFGNTVEKHDEEIDTRVIVEAIATIMSKVLAVEVIAACSFGLKEPNVKSMISLLDVIQHMAAEDIEFMWEKPIGEPN